MVESSTVIMFFILIGIVIYISANYIERNAIVPSNDTPETCHPTKNVDHLYIYNHTKIQIDVFAETDADRGILAKTIAPGGRKRISSENVISFVRRGYNIVSYPSDIIKHGVEPISTAKLVIPENSTVRSLHVGMNAGQYDLSMASEITKSGLGTALAMVRLVNTTPRIIRLNYNIVIPPMSSVNYRGENDAGIPLGLTLKDCDGIFEHYVINIPVSDIFFGVTSDKHLSKFGGAQFGFELDDTTEVVIFPLQLGMYGPHRGSLVDRSQIV